MPAITIRDVPEETRDELAARASATGRSLQEYLRRELIQLASRPDNDVLLARIAERKRLTGSAMTTREILELRDADRR
jgi:antitoxin FitA